MDTALSIDKLEKIGEKNVKVELKEKGISKESIEKLFDLMKTLNKKSKNEDKLAYCESLNGLCKEAVKELKEFFDYCEKFKVKVTLSPSLARGLAYYTSLMWEVYLKDSKIKSSVAAGGRWDKLIQNFLESKQEYPATGMAFGLDVIYEALNERAFNSVKLQQVPLIYLIPINALSQAIPIVTELRNQGISCDVAWEKKLSKALDYANKLQIPYCLIIGKKELEQKKVKLRDMKTGKEELMEVKDVIKKLSNL